MPAKAIIALGNNGDQYTWTRHNFGWLVADLLAKDMDVRFRVQSTYALAQGRCGGEVFYIVKPLAFMNLSGQPLKIFIKREKIELENLLVICDDVDLEFGLMKIRPHGGTGGHRGLRSIVQELGTTEFARLRLGIGRGCGSADVVDHVLGRFSKDERVALLVLLDKAARAAKDFTRLDWQMLMATYNSRSSEGARDV